MLRLALSLIAWMPSHGIAMAATPPGDSISAFYVSGDGNDSWSGHSAAPNADHTDGPFASFEAAQRAMRAGTGARLTYVRGGIYYLAAPLRLGPDDAGERFLAYGQEHPILRGGPLVTGWQRRASLFVAPAPARAANSPGIPDLFAEDGRLTHARYPGLDASAPAEAGWLFAAASGEGVDRHRSFRYRPGDLPDIADVKGVSVSIFGQRGWQNYVLPIKSVDRTRRLIELDGTTWDSLDEGSRYFLFDLGPDLKHPGEWYYDRTGQQIFYRPADLGAGPGLVYLGLLPCIVEIDRSQDVAIQGLQLEGTAAQGAAVCVDRSDQVVLEHDRLLNVGDGVRLTEATNSRISDNEIADLNGAAVLLRQQSDGNSVTGNGIHRVGLLQKDSSGIWFDGSSRNVFAHNRIEDVSKFAIGGGSLTSGGAYDNVIERNEIRRVNLQTSDGGAIMIIGWAQDATRDIIRGNFVSFTSAAGNVGWDGKPHLTFQDPITRLVSFAIYLDDWTSGVQVTGNLLCRNIGGIDLHAGWDNRVAGNVLIGNAGIALSADASVWLGEGTHPHAMEHNLFEQNVVVLAQPSTGQSGVTAVGGPASVAAFDRNTYAGPGLNGRSFHRSPTMMASGYSGGAADWRALGQDLSSSIGDPSASVTLVNGTVRMGRSVGAGGPRIALLRVGDIGRVEDRAGFPARMHEDCGIPIGGGDGAPP